MTRKDRSLCGPFAQQSKSSCAFRRQILNATPDTDLAITEADTKADGSAAWLQYEFDKRYTARALTLGCHKRIPVGRVLVSDDGTNWKTIVVLPGSEGYHGAPVRTFAFSAVTGRFSRIEIDGAGMLPAAVIHGGEAIPAARACDRPQPCCPGKTRARSLGEDDPALKYLSGTATYARSFTVPASWLHAGTHFVLDLGRVGDIAEVRINGTPAGTVWAPPYNMDVTAMLKPGVNRLEIAVTNEFTNRILGDKLLPEDKRLLGTAANVRMMFGGPKEPLPSGLLGGVTLKALQASRQGSSK
jgi:hypothetical protein